MPDTLEAPFVLPEKAAVTVLRHVRSYSIEITDASAVVAKTTADHAIIEMFSRLYQELVGRFSLREIQEILTSDPNRKMAVRVSLQLIDEGASDREIRQAAHFELQAFDEFVERERPKLLVKPQVAVRPQ